MQVLVIFRYPIVEWRGEWRPFEEMLQGESSPTEPRWVVLEPSYNG